METETPKRSYRCGEAGHLSASCVAPPKCPVCKDAQRSHDHCLGSRACRAPRVKPATQSPLTAARVPPTGDTTTPSAPRAEPMEEDAARQVIGNSSDVNIKSADFKNVRMDILSILLTRGADPNKVTESDGTTLRPVLAEYIASNVQLSPQVVHMLLKFGAKVVMKTQYRDPHGILNSLQNLVPYPKLLRTLLEGAEGFDLCMIRRSSYLTQGQKSALLELASKPLTLLHQCRLFFRKYFGPDLINVVPEFNVPACLHKYLLYED